MPGRRSRNRRPFYFTGDDVTIAPVWALEQSHFQPGSQRASAAARNKVRQVGAVGFRKRQRPGHQYRSQRGDLSMEPRAAAPVARTRLSSAPTIQRIAARICRGRERRNFTRDRNFLPSALASAGSSSESDARSCQHGRFRLPQHVVPNPFQCFFTTVASPDRGVRQRPFSMPPCSRFPLHRRHDSAGQSVAAVSAIRWRL